MYEELFQRILEASDKKSLTFFVGAGISTISGYPKWKDLIDLFCEEMNLQIKTEYSNDEYLKIPQMYYYSINKNDEVYYEFIKDCFEKNNIETNLIHKMLFDFNPNAFITTNFDDLLEEAAVENCESFKVIAKDDEISGINGDKFILKLHGDLNHKNIVLKEEDYLNYSENFKLTETLLKSIFSTNTVVFIGYGLNDYNIKLVLNWTKYLLKDKFNKPIFIYTGDEQLIDAELKYHESKGVSVIDYHNLYSSCKLKEDDYVGRYKCVLDSIKKHSEYSIDEKNEIEVFYKLYFLIKPLSKFNTLRIQDVKRKLLSFIFIDKSGIIHKNSSNSRFINYFQKLNNMNYEERNHLNKDILKKYKIILSIFSKARIRNIKEKWDFIEIKDSEYPFSNMNCILFDYISMLNYVNKQYNDDYLNYKKAFYLSKLQNYKDSYNLFIEVAISSFKKGDYFLHFLAQTNRYAVYLFIEKQNKIYNNYNDMDIIKDEELKKKIKKIFEKLPVNFQNQYKEFEDLISFNMLYEISYNSFIDGEELRNSIESKTFEAGITSVDKVISQMDNNLHFFLGNYLLVDVFSEFKNTMKNLMSLCIFKYSVQNKKSLLDDDFLSNKISFNEVDFYCIIEYFSYSEISKIFKRNDIETIKFKNEQQIYIAISNLLDYYSKILFKSKNKLEKRHFEDKIKKCLLLLRYVDISQELVDKICSFIFKYEFLEIYINDKIMFIDSQIYRRKMYSERTSKLIEDKLFFYMDNHLKAIKENRSFTLYSKNILNYYDLVHYISSKQEILHQKKLSFRVNTIIENNYLDMKEELLQHYYEYLSRNQQNKVIKWVKKELNRTFNFNDFVFLVRKKIKIKNDIFNSLICFLEKKYKQNSVKAQTGILINTNKYFNELDEIGFLCFEGYLDKNKFKQFVGCSDCFDFFYLFEKFDFTRFKTEWLIKFSKYVLEKISNNKEVKDKIIVLVLNEIKEDNLISDDKKKLINIIAKYFN